MTRKAGIILRIGVLLERGIDDQRWAGQGVAATLPGCPSLPPPSGGGAPRLLAPLPVRYDFSPMPRPDSVVEERTRQVRGVLLAVLLANLAVVAVKFLVGFGIGSLAVVGDAVHSSVDAINNLFGLAVVRFASKGPDAEHPYGHAKFESLGALLIVVFLSLSVFELLRGAWERLLTGAPALVITPLQVGAAGLHPAHQPLGGLVRDPGRPPDEERHPPGGRRPHPGGRVHHPRRARRPRADPLRLPDGRPDPRHRRRLPRGAGGLGNRGPLAPDAGGRRGGGRALHQEGRGGGRRASARRTASARARRRRSASPR